MAARYSGIDRNGKSLPFYGLAKNTSAGPRWAGKVRFVEEHIDDPIRWKQPMRIFVNSMSDLFHEKVSDEWLARIFGVMHRAHHHAFQVLTKRPKRMLAWMKKYWNNGDNRIAIDNIWLGVSVEDQKTADERIPLLIETSAAVRWISAEPLLEKIDLEQAAYKAMRLPESEGIGLDWVVVGGESGPGARTFRISWARSIIEQCREAGVPVFMKQIGSRPMLEFDETGIIFKNRKGGDMSEWPADLRFREFPKV